MLTADGADYIMKLFAGEPAVTEYHLALLDNRHTGIAVGGDELQEPGDDSYQRAVIKNQTANWDISHGRMTNEVPIHFEVAVSQWGTVSGWAICDSYERGKVLWVGEFAEDIHIGQGNQMSIPVGALTLDTNLLGWVG